MQHIQMKNLSKNNTFEDWEAFKKELMVLKNSVDCRVLLESLGFTIVRETAKEFRASCHIHGGDNSSAFRFNRESRTWVCFTHKCHDILGRDIISLIRVSKDLDFFGAVNYLKTLVGSVDLNDDVFNKLKIEQEKKAFIREHCTTHHKPSYVSEEHLHAHLSFRSNGFLKDGFSPKTLDHFEIGGGYVDGEGNIRDIIPIRDVDGTLLAYSLRDVRRIKDIDDSEKYIITPGLLKDRVLYNLNNAKDFLTTQKLIVVEGFKSVWKLYEIGMYNVVAVMGSVITPGQQSLIYKYANKGIAILFDNDVPGIVGANKAFVEMGKKIKITPLIMYGPEGTDPADLKENELLKILKNI